MEDRQVISMDKRGAAFALLAIVLVAALELVWYSAPQILEIRLWGGSTVSVALVLAVFALVAPVCIAWLMCGGQSETDANKAQN